MKSFLIIFGWIFGLLCVISAILQYNDPDPLLWIVIYSVSALISFGVATKKVPYTLPLIIGMLCLIGCFFVFPETYEGFEIGKGDIKNIEEGREAFGLMIIALVMFFFAWSRKRT